MTTLTLVRQRRRRSSRQIASAVLRVVLVLALLAIVLYPLAWLATSSLRPNDEVARNFSLIPDHATLANYSRGWNGLQTVSFARFFLNSTVIALELSPRTASPAWSARTPSPGSGSRCAARSSPS